MHEALRDIAAKIRRDVASSHFGDPRYAVVISADKVDVLTAAIPELLAQVTDLERRLSIAAELTVGDRQQIQALETRQQEQEQELGTLKVKAAELETTNDEARRFIRHLASEIDLLSKWWGEAKEGCADRDLRINMLETRVTSIATLLHADPFQTIDADLTTIEVAITTAAKYQTERREADNTARIAELEASLIAARSAAREVTHAHSEAIGLVGRLEVENARLRGDGGETSATIAAWQTATFGLATTRRDRLYRSWEAMDEAWAAVRDMDWNIRRPNLSRAIRAAEELAELISRLVADDADPRACTEVADVQIVLAGIPAAHGQEQRDLVNAKMITNRARSWELTGDGHGQHVEEP
jgi:hypothetical protein